MLLITGDPEGHEIGILEGRDGVAIPLRAWRRSDARAVICYLHGIGEHSGPFTAMGDILHESGLAVYTHDHRGFGLSGERRGHIKSFSLLLDDVESMLDLARWENPGKPVFLVGHSMGGHLALRGAYRTREWLSGVIALSPGFKTQTTVPLSLVLKVVRLALTAPETYITGDITDVPTTRNPHHLERVAQDEYWVRRFTAGFYVEMLRSIRSALAEVKQLSLPVLMLQAGEDYLVSPEANREIFHTMDSPDMAFRLIPGLYHNMIVEPEMPMVAEIIADWAKDRAALPIGLVTAPA